MYAAWRHTNSLLLRFAVASRGSAPTPRKPSRRLDPSFVPWVCIQILCQHNVGSVKSNSDHRNASFAATAPRSGGNARRKCAWGNVNQSCRCAFAHAFGMGAPHPSPVGDTFPSRGRLRYGSKFYVNITRVGRSCIPTIGMQASRQPLRAAAAALTADAAFRKAFVPSFRLFSSRAQRCGTRRNSAARRAHG